MEERLKWKMEIPTQVQIRGGWSNNIIYRPDDEIELEIIESKINEENKSILPPNHSTSKSLNNTLAIPRHRKEDSQFCQINSNYDNCQKINVTNRYFKQANEKKSKLSQSSHTSNKSYFTSNKDMFSQMKKTNKGKRNVPKTKNTQNSNITQQTQKNERFNQILHIQEEELENEQFESDTELKEENVPNHQTQNLLQQRVILRIKTCNKENLMLVEQYGPDMNLTKNVDYKVYLIVPYKLARTMSVGKSYIVLFEKKNLFENEERKFAYVFSTEINE